LIVLLEFSGCVVFAIFGGGVWGYMVFFMAFFGS
jgi:hypothetical protein